MYLLHGRCHLFPIWTRQNKLHAFKICQLPKTYSAKASRVFPCFMSIFKAYWKSICWQNTVNLKFYKYLNFELKEFLNSYFLLFLTICSHCSDEKTDKITSTLRVSILKNYTRDGNLFHNMEESFKESCPQACSFEYANQLFGILSMCLPRCKHKLQMIKFWQISIWSYQKKYFYPNECHTLFHFITGRNEVVAKVIFLHLSVILFTGGGGGSASIHAGIPTPPDHTPPEQTPLPPGSRLQHTVYERPVRILLECILVIYMFYITNGIF